MGEAKYMTHYEECIPSLEETLVKIYSLSSETESLIAR